MTDESESKHVKKRIKDMVSAVSVRAMRVRI